MQTAIMIRDKRDPFEGLPRPLGAHGPWWAMLVGDETASTRKAVTDRRAGTTRQYGSNSRTLSAWCLADEPGPVAGSLLWRQGGILVTASWPHSPEIGTGGEEIELVLDGLPLNGHLVQGGRPHDRLPVPVAWTLRFGGVVDKPREATSLVAEGFGVTEVPSSWLTVAYPELESARRAWLRVGDL